MHETCAGVRLLRRTPARMTHVAATCRVTDDSQTDRQTNKKTIVGSMTLPRFILVGYIDERVVGLLRSPFGKVPTAMAVSLSCLGLKGTQCP